MCPALQLLLVWCGETDQDRDLSPWRWRDAQAYGSPEGAPDPAWRVGKEGFLEAAIDKLAFD